MSRKLLIDIAERTFWTAVQAGAAFLAVAQLDIPPAYGVLIAMAAATIKGVAASHIGDDDTAAALPGKVE